MQTVRAAGALLCAAAIVLPGCAGSRPAEEAPAGVNLAGAWRLDHAASDDPQKILDQMRAQAFKVLGHPPPVVVTPNRPGKPGQVQSTDPAADAAIAQLTPTTPHGDPLRHSPMAHLIMNSVARGDFLTVRQSPNEFVLDYGTSRRSFTPGQHSVVSTDSGVGDQTSGWKGRQYLIEVRPQQGPLVTEEYGLSPDGKQLIAKLHIASGELPAVSMTRVYTPTNESAPQQLPTSD